MKVGLTGFSRAGKTTLYNALTGLSATVGGFEARHEAAMAVVKVPDSRVDALSEIVHPKEKKYAEVTFLDFPPSQERKAALENQSVVQLREVDAMAQVVRAFDDPLADEPAAPVRDLNAFQAELILADLAVIEKRMERIRKEASKDRGREMDLLVRCQSALEEERPLRASSSCRRNGPCSPVSPFSARSPCWLSTIPMNRRCRSRCPRTSRSTPGPRT